MARQGLSFHSQQCPDRRAALPQFLPFPLFASFVVARRLQIAEQGAIETSGDNKAADKLCDKNQQEAASVTDPRNARPHLLLTKAQGTKKKNDRDNIFDCLFRVLPDSILITMIINATRQPG